MRRGSWLLVALAAALVVAATAFAAAPSRDPMPLILRQADLPRGVYEADDGADAYLEDAFEAAGLTGAAAQYYGMSFSEGKGSLAISGLVVTTPSVAQARKLFATTRKARDVFLKRLRAPWTPVQLPSFGNQQVALIDPAGGEGIGLAELLVRKNRVVWLLYVKLERRPAPPNSELIGELKRYAAKQKTRVGAG